MIAIENKYVPYSNSFDFSSKNKESTKPTKALHRNILLPSNTLFFVALKIEMNAIVINKYEIIGLPKKPRPSASKVGTARQWIMQRNALTATSLSAQ